MTVYHSGVHSNQSPVRGQFSYAKARKKVVFLFLILLILIFGVDLLSILWISGGVHSQSYLIWRELLFNLQLPHVLSVLIVGAVLGLSGCVLQLYLRNPLADPALIGLSSGGSLSTACFLMLAKFLSWEVSLWRYTASALLGVLIVLIFLLKLANQLDRLGVAGLILLGIGVNACLGAVLSFAMVFLDQWHLSQILIWNLGAFQVPNDRMVLSGLVLFLMGFLGILGHMDDLDKLNFGERAAFSMGVDLKKLKTKVLLAVSCWVGAAVILAGPMAFLGLLAPHFARFWFGSLARFLLLGSACCGAIWLLVADLLSSFWVDGQMPVGVLCALMGGPFFIYLLIRMARR